VLLTHFIIILLMAGSYLRPVRGQRGEAEDLLQEAFNALVEAEEAGGEVDLLVDSLNHALDLLEEGRVEEAEGIIRDVIDEAPEVRASGVREWRFDVAVAGATVAGLVIASILVWVYGSRLFWRLWLRVKEGWVVVRAD
jgi:hypothetical protein